MIVKILEEIHWVLRIACTVLISVWLGCQIFRIDDLETWIQLGEITYKYITFGPRELPGLEEKRIYEHHLFSKKGMLEMCWAKFRTLLGSFHYYLAYSWAFFCVWGVHSDGDLVWILFTNKSTTLSFFMVVDSTALAMKLLEMKWNLLEKTSPLYPSSSWRNMFSRFLNSHYHWYFFKACSLKRVQWEKVSPYVLQENATWCKNFQLGPHLCAIQKCSQNLGMWLKTMPI